MSLGERIAKVLAPEAVSLQSDYVKRLREAYDFERKRADYLARENKRLRKALAKHQSIPSSTRKA